MPMTRDEEMDMIFTFTDSPEAIDRYTITMEAFPVGNHDVGWVGTFGASGAPFHPQGFGQYCGEHYERAVEEANHVGWIGIPDEVKAFALMEAFDEVVNAHEARQLAGYVIMEQVSHNHGYDWPIWSISNWQTVDLALNALALLREQFRQGELFVVNDWQAVDQSLKADRA